MHLHKLLRRAAPLLRCHGGLSLLLVGLLLVAACPGCSHHEIRKPVTPTLIEDGPKELRILRADYEAVIKAGIQPVMRWYLTMPAYDAAENFLGFRIVRILKDELKDGPLKLGDVLRRVNGRAIETPGQVEIVWRELWSRKTLTLSMIRGVHPMDITIPIVGVVDG